MKIINAFTHTKSTQAYNGQRSVWIQQSYSVDCGRKSNFLSTRCVLHLITFRSKLHNSTVCLRNTYFRWYYGYIYLYL